MITFFVQRGYCAASLQRDLGIEKNLPGFPVAEHFNTNGHTIQDAKVRGIMLCDGNKQRKRQEMRLICRLGTSQPRGMNSDFRYL